MARLASSARRRPVRTPSSTCSVRPTPISMFTPAAERSGTWPMPRPTSKAQLPPGSVSRRSTQGGAARAWEASTMDTPMPASTAGRAWRISGPPRLARFEEHGDLELLVGALAARGRQGGEARLGTELVEHGAGQAGLDPGAPRLEPRVTVVVALVVLAELGGKLDAH